MYQLFNNHFNVPCHRRCSSTLLSETETKEKSKTKHFRRATWKIRSLQQLRPKRLQYLINSWQNPTKLSVTWALPGRRDDPRKSQFPEVLLHLVCAPAWQASLMWGQRMKKPQKNLTLNNPVFPSLWFTRNKPWLEHNNAEVSAVNRWRCCICVLMDEPAAPRFQENTAPPQLPAKGTAADQTALFA